MRIVEFKSGLFWMDNWNVLCWIRPHKKFEVLVALRISEIRETSATVDWRCVPSKLNFADHVTKWRQKETDFPTKLMTTEFFTEGMSKWPAEPKNVSKLSDEILENAMYILASKKLSELTSKVD